ncbi:ArgE/DapE family deacylase [Rhodopseudomonas sp. P2A-2r]|uniref:ArgE/DapE family deacylase n=1 Tax=unclassified Rhodopseudomonas TaxID=2638247 RepID=UPI002234B3D0|nr:ArgE/DapE family deacylase [Rhodopseudomonas sp. P2A-2r]UZE49084.1 ArgE/DapE family deacylase [Rhodopseudomonas sp. P2A-2r]
MSPNETQKRQILEAVDALFDEQLEFLKQIVRIPSQRGEEEKAQMFMADAMAALDLDVDKWIIDVESIKDHPGFSPVSISYERSWNVVGTHRPKQTGGRSLVLNGHIDVVPTGADRSWTYGPYEPTIKDGWMYGRGAGDMKSGLSANLFAFKALKRIGLQPAAIVYVQSVVEEECTGNGALACVVRGYTADAGFIPEPLEPKLLRGQIGPIWIRVEVSGAPGHASGDFGLGADAIGNAIELIQSLKELEARWNARKGSYPPFQNHPHPINFNVGRIQGGEWTSSAPSACVFEVRVAVYPGQAPADACKEFETYVAEVSSRNPFLSKNPPTISYPGFMQEGYHLTGADEQESILGRCHAEIWGEALKEHAFAATTDARSFGLYGGCPTLVYGPYCRNPHAFDECVDLESLRKVTKTLALFMAEWCGVEGVE